MQRASPLSSRRLPEVSTVTAYINVPQVRESWKNWSQLCRLKSCPGSVSPYITDDIAHLGEAQEAPQRAWYCTQLRHVTYACRPPPLPPLPHPLQESTFSLLVVNRRWGHVPHIVYTYNATIYMYMVQPPLWLLSGEMEETHRTGESGFERTTREGHTLRHAVLGFSFVTSNSRNIFTHRPVPCL